MDIAKKNKIHWLDFIISTDEQNFTVRQSCSSSSFASSFHMENFSLEFINKAKPSSYHNAYKHKCDCEVLI